MTHANDALDVDPFVFTVRDPRAMARLLLHEAEQYGPSESSAFRTAMSRLVFYTRQAGPTLSKSRRAQLEAVKVELRALYQRSHE